MVGATGDVAEGGRYSGDCGDSDSSCYHGPLHKLNMPMAVSSNTAGWGKAESKCVCLDTCTVEVDEGDAVPAVTSGSTLQGTATGPAATTFSIAAQVSSPEAEGPHNVTTTTDSAAAAAVPTATPAPGGSEADVDADADGSSGASSSAGTIAGAVIASFICVAAAVGAGLWWRSHKAVAVSQSAQGVSNLKWADHARPWGANIGRRSFCFVRQSVDCRGCWQSLVT